MLQPTLTSWVILAGGQASQPLIEYVIERLTPQTSNILINANRNQDDYQQYGPVFGDHFQNFPGPMGGIHAGLMHANTDWVGFVPCDCPRINEDLVEFRTWRP